MGGVGAGVPVVGEVGGVADGVPRVVAGAVGDGDDVGFVGVGLVGVLVGACGVRVGSGSGVGLGSGVRVSAGTDPPEPGDDAGCSSGWTKR